MFLTRTVLFGPILLPYWPIHSGSVSLTGLVSFMADSVVFYPSRSVSRLVQYCFVWFSAFSCQFRANFGRFSEVLGRHMLVQFRLVQFWSGLLFLD
jgi:hypothetical protein